MGFALAETKIFDIAMEAVTVSDQDLGLTVM